MKMLFYCRLNLLLIGLLCLTSCASQQVAVSLSTDHTLNPSESGQALPVVMKLYQLTDKTNFQHATFDELWNSDESVLSKTLQDKQIVTINPNSVKIIKLKRKSDVHYLGVVALFRHPERNQWREVIPLSRGIIGHSVSVKIVVKNNRLLLIKPEKE